LGFTGRYCAESIVPDNRNTIGSMDAKIFMSMVKPP
jgi:hypothetical protein